MVKEADSVGHVYDYRAFCLGHPSFPPSLPTMAFDVLLMHQTPTPPSSAPALGDISSGRRRWKERKGALGVPEPGEVIVNSNLLMDWSFSFGFPTHQVAYHRFFSFPNFLRVYQANMKRREEYGARVELAFSLGDEDEVKRVQEVVDDERRA
ncbi:hypothetical protein IAR50_006603 [Cryptococcus sp. DSM 104548]